MLRLHFSVFLEAEISVFCHTAQFCDLNQQFSFCSDTTKQSIYQLLHLQVMPLMTSSSSSSTGSSPSVSTKKPRSRGLFSSLLCCLCRDQPEPQPVNNNAPLLVEENGTVSKVGLPSFRWLHSSPVLPAVERSNLCWTGDGEKRQCSCSLALISSSFSNYSFCGIFRSRWSHCCLQWSQKTLERSVWL